MIKKQHKTIDYIFWILFILFSNPGGILQALGLVSKNGGGINLTDVFFLLMSICYVLISIYDRDKINDIAYKKTVNFLIVFLIYYFLVFGYFVPVLKEVPDYSLSFFLIKSRHTIYSFLLFVYVYKFFIRDPGIFYRFLIISSIFILILFVLTIVTGVEILPIKKMNRRFTSTERIFLYSYGFMFLIIPIGSVVLVFFKHKFKWKKWLIFAFLLMFLAWILSITRRRIIGTFVYMIIASIMFNFFQRKPLIPFKKIMSLTFYILIFGFILNLTFPKYADAGYKGLEEAITIVTTGKTSTGSKDARMGMGKEFMQDIIIENPYFGTGFDNRWRTIEGDEQGYEASDYPFIGAIAMTGIFGILFFLPVYIILIKSLIYDLKYLRNNNIEYKSIEVFSLITFILYMLFDLVQYMNLFLPVSLSGRYRWYIFLGMYMGSRQIFYKSQQRIIRYE